jgi:hypothetical protein
MSSQNSSGQSAPKGAYETRRNSTSCFKNRDRTEDWQPHYVGAVALEDSQKYWARLWVRVDRNSGKYLSLNLKPFQQKASATPT